MKILLALAVVCVLAGLISCESCSHTSDCMHTTCDPTSHVGCVSGTCTCLLDPTHSTSCPSSCGPVSDCNGCHCRPGREHHCIDGKCKCTFHFPGK